MMAVASGAPLRGELKYEESMAQHTSWRTGGPAQHFYRPADRDDLAAYLRQLPADEPLLWVGLGSNLLVRDGGVRGSVIYTQGALDTIERVGEFELYAEAGVPCAKVARVCARAGLAGAEFLAGIPGTMGGALAMNAGAFGGETWQRVVSVQTLDRAGELRWREPADYRIAYRHVSGPPGEWFVAVTLRLSAGDPEQLQARIRELLAQRGASQPTNKRSCGSVFRNPPGEHAARLIQRTGLKGLCIGGACVSQKHANFIINEGDATAADVEALIDYVREKVAEKHGIRLQPEVRIVGEVLS